MQALRQACNIYLKGLETDDVETLENLNVIIEVRRLCHVNFNGMWELYFLKEDGNVQSQDKYWWDLTHYIINFINKTLAEKKS